ADQFNELGLFNTMQVYPAEESDDSLDVETPVLDDHSVGLLSAVPGVNLAYPFDDFPVEVAYADTQITADAQALPVTAIGTKMFSQLSAGTVFSSDSAREVMVAGRLLSLLGVEEPDSILGRPLVLSVGLSTVDSGLAHVLLLEEGSFREHFADLTLDSLRRTEFLERRFRLEVNDAIKRFVDGYLNARKIVSDTLIVTGVIDTEHGPRRRMQEILVPVATARKFTTGGFSGDPTDLFAAMKSGTFLAGEEDAETRNYPRVTLDLDPNSPYEPIRDSVQALGYETFSYAEQFDEIRKAFLYFNMVVGIVGLIALVTAALGIINTMVMSIVERRREIGVLKSLGADERDIRLLFLAESGMIGAVGSTVGIMFGWLIARAASFISQAVMEQREIPRMDLFDTPLWLIGIAFLFGLCVSLAAGLYPASRAARVDPVEALRND
ncbi:MAG: ABC transporter permease, partial [bacterium]|nr:ABC transporter permease [bacterium]